VAVHRLVALARAVLQIFRIEDLDFATGIFDEAGGLQGVRNNGHAGSPDSEHFRQSAAAPPTTPFLPTIAASIVSPDDRVTTRETTQVVGK
jgi:hypothetical protein